MSAPMPSDPLRRLTAAEVDAAGLSDWRMLVHHLKARFRTGSFATGLALVDRIGAAAEAADHHPEIMLGYPEVIVTLSSHDAGGVTSRDIDLARTISGYAAELGCAADIAGLTHLELALDTALTERQAPYYSALLGASARAGELVDGSGQVPSLWWQEPGADDEWALPEPAVPQRWHLDVWVAQDEAPHRVAAVLAAGGRLVSDASAPSYWVIEDPEGNRSCICTVSGVGEH